ncbi:MAG: tRNA (adenosine(37)-N6)-threonylcarbamoyltransferase complex ATPase subunit type 1 TsaE [Gammaproteobacteria bacterium]|nr:tRNA (adenosine(37)-N6)-threonylcarbamoyltransferase complex ATPase subunit type 1 TsaE [Gammaproteobacteria bacterium]
MIQQTFSSEHELQTFGEQLALKITAPCIIYLHGDLGAGKTCLVRGILRGLGYSGNVKSPTYTLVELYQISEQTIYHLDLYRLNDPEELEHIGFRDYLDHHSIMLIEWPEKAQGFLPPADLEINIKIEDGQRRVEML